MTFARRSHNSAERNRRRSGKIHRQQGDSREDKFWLQIDEEHFRRPSLKLVAVLQEQYETCEQLLSAIYDYFCPTNGTSTDQFSQSGYKSGPVPVESGSSIDISYVDLQSIFDGWLLGCDMTDTTSPGRYCDGASARLSKNSPCQDLTDYFSLLYGSWNPHEIISTGLTELDNGALVSNNLASLVNTRPENYEDNETQNCLYNPLRNKKWQGEILPKVDVAPLPDGISVSLWIPPISETMQLRVEGNAIEKLKNLSTTMNLLQKKVPYEDLKYQAIFEAIIEATARRDPTWQHLHTNDSGPGSQDTTEPPKQVENYDVSATKDCFDSMVLPVIMSGPKQFWNTTKFESDICGQQNNAIDEKAQSHEHNRVLWALVGKEEPTSNTKVSEPDNILDASGQKATASPNIPITDEAFSYLNTDHAFAPTIATNYCALGYEYDFDTKYLVPNGLNIDLMKYRMTVVDSQPSVPCSGNPVDDCNEATDARWLGDAAPMQNGYISNCSDDEYCAYYYDKYLPDCYYYNFYYHLDCSSNRYIGCDSDNAVPYAYGEDALYSNKPTPTIAEAAARAGCVAIEFHTKASDSSFMLGDCAKGLDDGTSCKRIKQKDNSTKSDIELEAEFLLMRYGKLAEEHKLRCSHLLAAAEFERRPDWASWQQKEEEMLNLYICQNEDKALDSRHTYTLTRQSADVMRLRVTCESSSRLPPDWAERALCSCCGSGEDWDDDPILFCDGCYLPVHFACLGNQPGIGVPLPGSSWSHTAPGCQNETTASRSVEQTKDIVWTAQTEGNINARNNIIGKVTTVGGKKRVNTAPPASENDDEQWLCPCCDWIRKSQLQAFNDAEALSIIRVSAGPKSFGELTGQVRRGKKRSFDSFLNPKEVDSKTNSGKAVSPSNPLPDLKQNIWPEESAHALDTWTPPLVAYFEPFVDDSGSDDGGASKDSENVRGVNRHSNPPSPSSQKYRDTSGRRFGIPPPLPPPLNPSPSGSVTGRLQVPSNRKGAYHNKALSIMDSEQTRTRPCSRTSSRERDPSFLTTSRHFDSRQPGRSSTVGNIYSRSEVGISNLSGLATTAGNQPGSTVIELREMQMKADDVENYVAGSNDLAINAIPQAAGDAASIRSGSVCRSDGSYSRAISSGTSFFCRDPMRRLVVHVPIKLAVPKLTSPLAAPSELMSQVDPAEPAAFSYAATSDVANPESLQPGTTTVKSLDNSSGTETNSLTNSGHLELPDLLLSGSPYVEVKIPVCSLCGYEAFCKGGGPVKETDTAGIWAHIRCALAVKGLVAETVKYKVEDDRVRLRCETCGQCGPAPVQCKHPSCYRPYHVSCATADSSCMVDWDELPVVYCGAHSKNRAPTMILRKYQECRQRDSARHSDIPSESVSRASMLPEVQDICFFDSNRFSALVKSILPDFGNSFHAAPGNSDVRPRVDKTLPIRDFDDSAHASAISTRSKTYVDDTGVRRRVSATTSLRDAEGRFGSKFKRGKNLSITSSKKRREKDDSEKDVCLPKNVPKRKGRPALTKFTRKIAQGSSDSDTDTDTDESRSDGDATASNNDECVNLNERESGENSSHKGAVDRVCAYEKIMPISSLSGLIHGWYEICDHQIFVSCLSRNWQWCRSSGKILEIDRIWDKQGVSMSWNLSQAITQLLAYLDAARSHYTKRQHYWGSRMGSNKNSCGTGPFVNDSVIQEVAEIIRAKRTDAEHFIIFWSTLNNHSRNGYPLRDLMLDCDEASSEAEASRLKLTSISGHTCRDVSKAFDSPPTCSPSIRSVTPPSSSSPSLSPRSERNSAASTNRTSSVVPDAAAILGSFAENASVSQLFQKPAVPCPATSVFPNCLKLLNQSTHPLKTCFVCGTIGSLADQGNMSLWESLTHGLDRRSALTVELDVCSECSVCVCKPCISLSHQGFADSSWNHCNMDTTFPNASSIVNSDSMSQASGELLVPLRKDASKRVYPAKSRYSVARDTIQRDYSGKASPIPKWYYESVENQCAANIMFRDDSTLDSQSASSRTVSNTGKHKFGGALLGRASKQLLPNSRGDPKEQRASRKRCANKDKRGSHQWVCMRCEWITSESQQNLRSSRCILCGRVDGALVRRPCPSEIGIAPKRDRHRNVGHPLDLSSAKLNASGQICQWVHMQCAEWLVSSRSLPAPNPLLSLTCISKAAFEKLCIYCGIQIGATLTCSSISCQSSFHVSCAKILGCRYETSSRLDQFGVRRAFCLHHSLDATKKSGGLTTRNHQALVHLIARPVERIKVLLSGILLDVHKPNGIFPTIVNIATNELVPIESCAGLFGDRADTSKKTGSFPTLQREDDESTTAPPSPLSDPANVSYSLLWKHACKTFGISLDRRYNGEPKRSCSLLPYNSEETKSLVLTAPSQRRSANSILQRLDLLSSGHKAQLLLPQLPSPLDGIISRSRTGYQPPLQRSGRGVSNPAIMHTHVPVAIATRSAVCASVAGSTTASVTESIADSDTKHQYGDDPVAQPNSLQLNKQLTTQSSTVHVHTDLRRSEDKPNLVHQFSLSQSQNAREKKGTLGKTLVQRRGAGRGKFRQKASRRIHLAPAVTDIQMEPRPHDEEVHCPGCGRVYIELPTGLPGDDKNWVGCDGCQNWYHYGCVGLTDEPTTEHWYCPSCLVSNSDLHISGITDDI